MKKSNNKGFLLAETLVSTIFVAGVLIFIFVQFSNLLTNYDESYNYNKISDLYTLDSIANYIESDNEIYNYIKLNVTESIYFDMSDCSSFTDDSYIFCTKVMEYCNINTLLVTTNDISKYDFSSFSESFKSFTKNIYNKSSEKYRLIVLFNDSSFATIRFGD